jgi:hypothetical protein
LRSADEAGQVKDIIYVLHHLAQNHAVEDGSIYEFDVESGKIAAVTGTKIIQHSHSGVPMKMFREMAADKSGTSSD